MLFRLSDNNIDLSDNDVDITDLYVDFVRCHVDLSNDIVVTSMALFCQ